MKAKTTYAFLTTKAFRFDIKAYNPKQAFSLASKAFKETNQFGKLTKTYLKYSRDGFASIYDWQSL